jgi:hypothetical protein
MSAIGLRDVRVVIATATYRPVSFANAATGRTMRN